MRRLLLLLTLFFTFSTIATAKTPSGQVENVKLNIKDNEMAITFLGISEGEATLIQGPNAENILVNTGGMSTALELEEWLDLYNVKKLKALILTNDISEDSINQLMKLVSKYKIKEIITTPKRKRQLVTHPLPADLTVTNWNAGTKTSILPEVSAIVQYAGDNQNEGLDFMLEFFNHRIFLMSSYSERAEKVLLNKNLEDVNIFKLPNYAMEDTLSKSLIHSLNPEISILFAGAEQLPNADILDDLHEAWSEIYYTKKHGTITIKFTETKYEVITIPIYEE
ncbi:hypothetical protein [Neobacillus kokaensis]|uniref:ATP-dependent DNA helicase n=1 Tax=Neobacillus kokaensis TaxID=2759023 RepID=A0ABQ3MZW1_9BACI|nr:hypothetical protein [Neobacillus kokaensis]GHH98213.1 hypothetical protein AM1BK_17560 [Neobacillus kokaensis]